MYIEPLNKIKKNSLTKEQVESGPAQEEKSFNKRSAQPETPKFIAEHSEETLCHWKAPEFESTFKKDKRWYFYLSLVLVVIVGYAVFSNNILMAIVFVLIGVLAYIYLEQEPRTLDFMITQDGVVAGREIYPFENLESFWIFYEPGEMKVISLKNKSFLLPYVHIPVHNEDPIVLREHLLKFIPEEKQNLNLVDTLERFLGI